MASPIVRDTDRLIAASPIYFISDGASAVCIFFVLSGYGADHSDHCDHAKRVAPLISWGSIDCAVLEGCPFPIYLTHWPIIFGLGSATVLALAPLTWASREICGSHRRHRPLRVRGEMLRARDQFALRASRLARCSTIEGVDG